jgi:phosphoglycolate phosphatase
LRPCGEGGYNARMVPPGRVALVFDMDNTLIGSHIDFPAIRSALITLLRDASALDASEDDLRRRAIAELVARGAAHDRAQGTALEAQMWKVIEAHEAAGLRDAAPLDESPKILQTLRGRGFRIAVLTNNGRAASQAALRSAGLSDWVETLVTREDAALKPAGDGVVEALRRLGHSGPAYMIGDSWIDGAAAAASGARFIAYRRSAEDLAERGVRPWRTITHLAELLDLALTG